MPPWEAPDETAHYLYAYHLRLGHIPTMDETYEAAQPPTYYWLAGQILGLLERADPELVRPSRPKLTPESLYTRYDWNDQTFRITWGAVVLRWLNVGVGFFTLTFTWWGLQQFSQNRAITLTALALVGLLPQFLHISASVSNDPLANMGGAFLFWLMAVLVTARPEQNVLPYLWLATVAALIFPLFIKLTILPISCALLVLVGWQLVSRYRRYWHWVAAGGSLVLLLMLAGLVLVYPESAEFLWRTVRWRLFYIWPDIFDYWPLRDVTRYYVTSFWGQVAWEWAGLPVGIVLALTWAALAGWLTSWRLWWGQPARLATVWQAVWLVMGLAVGLWWLLAQSSGWWAGPWFVPATLLLTLLLTRWRHGRVDPAGTPHALSRPELTALWLTVWLTLVILFKNFLTTPQYQGRFLFPALGAIMLLVAAGWYALLPPRLAAYLPHLTAALFVGLNLLLWYIRVIPIFYQPFLD